MRKTSVLLVTLLAALSLVAPPLLAQPGAAVRDEEAHNLKQYMIDLTEAVRKPAAQGTSASTRP